MKLVTKNKRAYFDYEISNDYVAGIILQGHEVKSIKSGHINIQDTIISIQNSEIRILGMDIPLYGKTSPILAPNYQAKKKRKLLLNKKEISKIAAQLDKPGMVALALEVYIARGGFIKVKIGLGRLKKKIEKKQLLKEKSIEKEMRKEAKQY
ncbi:MAG: SsrA-binding protein SmpB [Candidatus Absconditabacteria bacterium]|nr:SsrA-binding protein SmpB [Candidatus Absconditabacteria bacterium]MDD3868345.1 SsrA-binding protein SmpB [Candidatus Absconditabacteria bacterium]MDD4714420.1 SsrA-binding protein SmpB [Candidatus Absconditabacteria bacterium]